MRKLSVSEYLPTAMSASRAFKTSSSRPTLAGVPWGHAFVGKVGAEAGEAACPAAGRETADNEAKHPTEKMARRISFFMIRSRYLTNSVAHQMSTAIFSESI